MRISHKKLLKTLTYNPETGHFFWINGRKGTVAGRQAGSKNALGYIVITIDRKFYLAHRLAWFYFNGKWPAQDIDHINCIKDDNRLCNLREATRSQNIANRNKQRRNKTGHKCVEFSSDFKKFKARIRCDGRTHYLGSFDTAKDAAKEVHKKCKELQGEFARFD